MAEEEKETNQNQNQGGKQKSLLDQAMDAILKSGKEAVMTKLKENRKKWQEHARGMALCDAEAKKIVDDFEAGLI